MHRKTLSLGVAMSAILSSVGLGPDIRLPPRQPIIRGRRSSGIRRPLPNAPQQRQGEREISRRLRQDIRKLMKEKPSEQKTGLGLVRYQHNLHLTEYTLWDDMLDEGAYSKFRSASSAQLLEIRASLG